jgi:hypothetical protein
LPFGPGRCEFSAVGRPTIICCGVFAGFFLRVRARIEVYEFVLVVGALGLFLGRSSVERRRV